MFFQVKEKILEFLTVFLSNIQFLKMLKSSKLG